jgi:hypothetical protein
MRRDAVVGHQMAGDVNTPWRVYNAYRCVERRTSVMGLDWTLLLLWHIYGWEKWSSGADEAFVELWVKKPRQHAG